MILGLINLLLPRETCTFLKKRNAYLVSFVPFIVAKVKKTTFAKPVLNVQYLDSAYLKKVKYVQLKCLGAAINSPLQSSPDDFDALLKRLKEKSNEDKNSIRRINESKALCILRPCVGSDLLFRVEGRVALSALQ